MANETPPRRNAVPIAIGVIGMLIEVIGIVLISSNRLSMAAATPLVIAGMFMAFVPVFVLARRARR